MHRLTYGEKGSPVVPRRWAVSPSVLLRRDNTILRRFAPELLVEIGHVQMT